MESKVANITFDNFQGSYRWCNPGKETGLNDQKVQTSKKTTGKEIEDVQNPTFEQFNEQNSESNSLSERSFQGNSVSLGNGPDAFSTITFESYLGEQSRKRQRLERKSRGSKGQSLTEIVARQGKGPLNYAKLAEEMIVKV
ncbi:hypothetical protein OnM2_096019 [Erysiphe neolycopersici]|uniref:Uncharacterized protein n=1 Tax=Erysiphe neolycopersici TaxID=212602 RepID=A0A420HB50_9PEZI|nr:hypothetical protein OnM2_096019 [Erysiphe neolycopersici]